MGQLQTQMLTSRSSRRSRVAAAGGAASGRSGSKTNAICCCLLVVLLLQAGCFSPPQCSRRAGLTAKACHTLQQQLQKLQRAVPVPVPAAEAEAVQKVQQQRQLPVLLRLAHQKTGAGGASVAGLVQQAFTVSGPPSTSTSSNRGSIGAESSDCQLWFYSRGVRRGLRRLLQGM